MPKIKFKTVYLKWVKRLRNYPTAEGENSEKVQQKKVDNAFNREDAATSYTEQATYKENETKTRTFSKTYHALLHNFYRIVIDDIRVPFIAKINANVTTHIYTTIHSCARACTHTHARTHTHTHTHKHTHTHRTE